MKMVFLGSQLQGHRTDVCRHLASTVSLKRLIRMVEIFQALSSYLRFGSVHMQTIETSNYRFAMIMKYQDQLHHNSFRVFESKDSAMSFGAIQFNG